jgi:Arc/MetJ-type ribon-helix-helix transcriptional regulator
MASPHTKVINIALSKDLLRQLDKAAFAEYMSRSAYIRRAVTDKLNTPPPPTDHWRIVEALPDTINDEELVKIVRRVKNWNKP